MKADLTRDTFNPLKHFTRVLMQQGRVQLDADWNEQAAILLHYLQTLAADLLGPHGGPSDGFQITQASNPLSKDFLINSGHYYVDGILCELESTPVSVVPTEAKKLQISAALAGDADFLEGQYVEVYPRPPSTPPSLAKITSFDRPQLVLTLDSSLSFGPSPMIRRVATYVTQPDLPEPDAISGAEGGTTYLVYLDVWERHITYLEDERTGRPGIREVALGGPDTATRAKVVWQVRTTDQPPGETPFPTNVQDKSNWLTANWDNLVQRWQPANRGALKARVKPAPVSNDPCLMSPDARYRGAENQLYRVEIHEGGSVNPDKEGSASPTFKWSRENGSVLFPILQLTSSDQTTTVTLANLGRDDRFGLAEGDWVEIVDDDYVLQNRAEALLKVHAIDRTALTVTLEGAPTSKVGTDSTKHPLLRRWDQKAGDPDQNGLTIESDGTALIVETSVTNDVWLDLEGGIQIQLQAGATYRTGDYWLIPARTATGDVEWPIEVDDQGQPVLDNQNNVVPITLPPHGVEHHYAPLAVVPAGTMAAIQDLRLTFGAYAK